MNITEDLRKNLFTLLTEEVISSMEEGKLTSEGAYEASNFILSHLESINSDDELQLFLQEISSRWDIFKNIHSKLLESKSQQEDLEKIHQIKGKLDQLITN